MCLNLRCSLGRVCSSVMQIVWDGATQNSVCGRITRKSTFLFSVQLYFIQRRMWAHVLQVGFGFFGFFFFVFFPTGQGRRYREEKPSDILEGFAKHLGLNCQDPTCLLPCLPPSVIPHPFWVLQIKRWNSYLCNSHRCGRKRLAQIRHHNEQSQIRWSDLFETSLKSFLEVLTGREKGLIFSFTILPSGQLWKSPPGHILHARQWAEHRRCTDDWLRYHHYVQVLSGQQGRWEKWMNWCVLFLFFFLAQRHELIIPYGGLLS